MLRLTGRIGGDRLAVSFGGDGISDNPDAAVPLFLMAAMGRGEPLSLEEPISPRLLESVPTLQGLIRMWWPEHRHVGVEAGAREAIDARPGVAAFFTCGVDSFYIVLRHRERIECLVFVHGFDISRRDEALWEQASRSARGAAGALDLPLVLVRTDLRDVLGVSDGYWAAYHGAALATVAHLLADRVGSVLIPASNTYRDLFPWGSHPAFDPLWSSDRLEIVHDSAHVTRVGKTGAIAESQVVLDHLRVCWGNAGAAYNCGRCPKCVRTMIALRLHGKLGECRTLPDELDLERVGRLRLGTRTDVTFTRQNLAAARERDPDVAAALEHALRRHARRARARDLARRLRRSPS